MFNMRDLKIEYTEDWNNVETKLRQLMRNMPEFYNDFYRLKKNVEIKIKELGEIDLKLRRNNTLYYKQLRTDKVQEINEIIRLFSKMYLIASLAKR